MYDSYIESARTLRWCYKVLINKQYPALRVLGPVPYLEDSIVSVVNRWKKDYDLPGKYPLGFPPRLRQSGGRSATPMSASSHSISKKVKNGKENKTNVSKSMLDAILESVLPKDGGEEEFATQQRNIKHFSDSDSDDEIGPNESIEKIKKIKSKSYSGQGFVIPRKDAKAKAIAARKISKEKEDAVASAMAARLQKFNSRMVKNLLDSSSSSEDEDL